MVSPSIVRRLIAGRQDTYILGASTEHHAALAHIEPHQLDPEEAKYAHAYVANPSAMEILHRVIDPGIARDQAALRIGGGHISPADLSMARNLMDTAHLEYGQHRGTAQLRDALERAANAGKSFVVVNGNPDFSDARRQIHFREELHHAMQADLGGGESLVAHIWRSQVPFYQNLSARIAVKALGRYGKISDGQMAAEIGVRLMDSGRFAELGLQYNQGRSLAAHYIRTLRKEYGQTAPRDIAREIFGSFREPPAGGS